MADFRLSDADKTTGVWLRLKTHLTDRLALLRLRNDGPLSEIETAATRGEIKAIRQIIALDAAALVTATEDEP